MVREETKKQMGWMARLLPGGIRERLFLLIALALIPAIALQGWIYYQHYTTRRSQALQMELEVAQGVAATFTSYLNDVRQQLNTTGQAILAFTPYSEAKAEYLLGIVARQYPTIRNLSWVSPQGGVLASSLPALVGSDLSGRMYFQRILAGQAWALGDLMPMGSVTKTPIFVIASAIRDTQGALRGAVMAAIEPTRLGERTFVRERPARGAYTIFDSQGQLVYRSPEIPLTWEQRSRWRQSDPLLQQALENHVAQGAVTSAIDGDRRVVARVPIADVGWVAGASRPMNIALRPVWLALIQDAALGLLVMLSAFLLAYLIARTIAGPLLRLERDARAMGEGRMGPPTEPGGPKEVRRLRGTMTRMATDLIQRAEALRDLNATLESKVVQRTAQLQQRARQLQKLALELSQAEDRERKRLAEILHDDLQQIIAGAKFHLELLRSRVKSDASLQALTAQIDQMLKEAIEKSRSLSHELSPVILHHGDFTETLGWLAGQVRAKHGLVVQVHAGGPAQVQSDVIKTFLYRTAQELLFNVVKHARVKEAVIRFRRCGPYVCLSVSDRGRGFDPQGLREATGFGLLSICERIELLGGRMKIKSALGKGSTFLVVVPDAEEVVGSRTSVVCEKREKEPADHRLPTTGYRPPLRVLLADDHRIVREGLRLLLSDEGDIQIVGEAVHGREAVDLALRLEPDVVIMDVSMPLIDGDVATRQIKEHLPQTRVIALSTYNEPGTIAQMYQAGAEGYVLKTASAAELLAAIRGQETDRMSSDEQDP
jgi:signal transduction histidine kinase/ActR/RegA family two-component response regulator